MSHNPRFEIESILEGCAGKPLVTARRLDNRDFLLQRGSLLGGVAILSGNIPRAINEAGQQRSDLWGFWLCDPADVARFSVGQVVELEESVDYK